MTEKTLDNLITRLKTEAIEKAEQEARTIIDEAQRKADMIIRDVMAQKSQILEEASTEADAIVHKGQRALQQAFRDVRLALQNDLLDILGEVLGNEVKRTFTAELTKTTVEQVIENVGKPSEITLPVSVQEELSDFIRLRLQQSDKLLTVKGDDQVLHGFTITRTDQGWKYEISPEEVGELLYSHLTPAWINLLKKDTIL